MSTGILSVRGLHLHPFCTLSFCCVRPQSLREFCFSPVVFFLVLFLLENNDENDIKRARQKMLFLWNCYGQNMVPKLTPPQAFPMGQKHDLHSLWVWFGRFVFYRWWAGFETVFFSSVCALVVDFWKGREEVLSPFFASFFNTAPCQPFALSIRRCAFLLHSGEKRIFSVLRRASDSFVLLIVSNCIVVLCRCVSSVCRDYVSVEHVLSRVAIRYDMDPYAVSFDALAHGNDVTYGGKTWREQVVEHGGSWNCRCRVGGCLNWARF